MSDFVSTLASSAIVLWFIGTSIMFTGLIRAILVDRMKGSPITENEDELMVALNARQLDSLLINAIEGRLGESDIDDVLKGDLADDFITIAISYGDGRVRQATKLRY